MNHTIADVAVPTARSKITLQYKWGISEASFRRILYLAGLSLLILLVAIFFSLVVASLPALRQFGLRLLDREDLGPGAG